MLREISETTLLFKSLLGASATGHHTPGDRAAEPRHNAISRAAFDAGATFTGATSKRQPKPPKSPCYTLRQYLRQYGLAERNPDTTR